MHACTCSCMISFVMFPYFMPWQHITLTDGLRSRGRSLLPLWLRSWPPPPSPRRGTPSWRRHVRLRPHDSPRALLLQAGPPEGQHRGDHPPHRGAVCRQDQRRADQRDQVTGVDVCDVFGTYYRSSQKNGSGIRSGT